MQSENCGKSIVLNISCPHVSSSTETINCGEIISCSNCDHRGPNLWICLDLNCLQVGCSEQAKDHSTLHFQRNKTHCIQMNLSSQRIWCYLCESEIFNGVKANTSLLSTSTCAINTNPTILDINRNCQKGLVGLQNIANTCYMNAAIQALSNIQPLTHYFLNNEDMVEYILYQNPNRSKAGLARSYLRLMQDIWCKNVKKGDCIAPRSILYGIRTAHSFFRGFQQHDTQEFLRCFMDQLHEELKEQNSTVSISCGFQLSCRDEEGILENLTSRSSSRSNSISETEYETCDSNISESNSLINESQPVHKKILNNSTNTKSARSIITDIFDGKLLSCVQCLTCDRTSTREEAFQDLSLAIPNGDYLNVLHQTQSLSSQSINSIDTSSKTKDSWLYWMWNLFRIWFWGPNVTLHDCLASFFSADELKGDNMYSCEKCKKLRTGIKYSKILDLPEVICIHLKRFRHDLSYSSKISSHVQFPLDEFDMEPYLHKNCKSVIWKYYLVSVICHHGTVGGGHYTCFARNEPNKRWFEFDDERVTEVSSDTVEKCQAYVLFYRKHNYNMDLIRAKANKLSHSNPVNLADNRFYIAREWIFRFNTFAEPGPINNWAILCPHGGLLQSKNAHNVQFAVPISQPLWLFLSQKFGGGPSVSILFECEKCKRVAEVLASRQKYELSVFTKYNKTSVDEDAGAIYAISMAWLRKWKLYARGMTSREPGPITNTNIVCWEVCHSFNVVKNIRPGSEYAELKAPLWRFLHGIYGGGPAIILREQQTDKLRINGTQDNLENYSTLDGVDVSDTESNIGLTTSQDIMESDVSAIVYQHVDLSKSALEEFSAFQPNDVIKQHKHTNAYVKKQRLCTVQNCLKKKTRKIRGPIKYTGLLGLRGQNF